ncbi:cadherin repeat domain-containing protein, partial [Roseibium hamelinense]|nr:cadherin repeat domain-containing protein [Roseibium hamelinense]
MTDTDLAANEFDEDVGPGTVVGLTGFAEDPDAGDTVTYAIDDPRFVIDPDTGVVTVAPNAEFDAETEPSITVVVTATSSDGSSSSETFTFNVLDVNENPIGPVTDE